MVTNTKDTIRRSLPATPRLETKTLNRFQNGPIIPAHMQHFPSCAHDSVLVMILSLYCTKNVLFFICLLEGQGIILILILVFFLPWFYLT